jgi:tetratricopeptide (TPR) repeat protein
MQAMNEMLSAGRVEEAYQQAAQRLARQPGDAEALVVMAKVALVQGRAAQAEELLRRAQGKGATQEALLVHAAVALQRQDWAGACGLYAPLLRQPSPPAEAWYGVGVARCALEDLEGARKALERAVAARPRHASYHFELGRVCALQGQVRQAVRHFARCLRLNPGDVRGYVAVAELASRQGKRLLARRVVQQGLRQVPEEEVLGAVLEALTDA